MCRILIPPFQQPTLLLHTVCLHAKGHTMNGWNLWEPRRITPKIEQLHTQCTPVLSLLIGCSIIHSKWKVQYHIRLRYLQTIGTSSASLTRLICQWQQRLHVNNKQFISIDKMQSKRTTKKRDGWHENSSSNNLHWVWKNKDKGVGHRGHAHLSTHSQLRTENRLP